MISQHPPIAVPSLFDGAFQFAYVTNDLDRAAALFHDTYGTGAFHFMRDIPNDDGTVSIALAYAGATNIELIEPGPDGPALYSDWIPGISGFALRHHHVGLLIEDQSRWDAMRQRHIDLGTAIPMEGEMPGAIAYLYADTTADLGHYLEYIRLFEGGIAMFSAIPGNPYVSR